MTERQPTNDDIRRSWDALATTWDRHMEAGETWQQRLIQPAVERVLELRGGERVLEIACGNGEFARRMQSLGASVVATDFSERMLEHARARGGDIDYRLVDATDREQLLALAPRGPFDAGVCNMAMMDMREIEPMVSVLSELLAPGRRFVFSIQHPAFNAGGVTRVIEQFDDARGVRRVHSVKVSSYIRPRVGMGVALEHQPEAQWYFDRPISLVFRAFFQCGFVLDALEEPVFAADQVTPGRSSAVFAEVPPVLVARMRRAQV